MLKTFFILLLFLFQTNLFAQIDSAVFASYTTEANRNKLYNTIVNSINKNLSLPLNQNTETKWEDVFSSIELIGYKTDFVKSRIKYAFDSIESRGFDFQRGLLELSYTNYPKDFVKEVNGFITQISNQES